MAKQQEGTKKSRKKSRVAKDKSKQGCAVSFLNEERGELDKECELTSEERGGEYAQPNKEKEAGGEG
jgi:hypothetical protein